MYTCFNRDRKSTRLNSSHTVIYTLSLHDALPILLARACRPCLLLSDFIKFYQSQQSQIYLINVHMLQSRSEERRVGKECRSLCDWSSDVCSSDLAGAGVPPVPFVV